jgi:hypothetical protein
LISQTSSPSNEISRQSETNTQNEISRDNSLTARAPLQTTTTTTTATTTTTGDNQSSAPRRDSVSSTSSTSTERFGSHEIVESGQNKNTSLSQTPSADVVLPNNK